ncbi:ATP-grasp domain-containing protein [Micromonospora tarensis]|uniref:ATP-grasp domain-containing protein n=1 Tax=Micromonospora tarensis TaxID=2806100 RepID=A0ABS1YDI5_9ACTN|nr:ATP-grasp domain-containing protein [Micromonospora tarensis]MBM0275417.1 ATP-grasp domain-containing protein [Micromonospora tarensis]
MTLLLVDSPGGPQPDEIVRALGPAGPARVLMLRSGGAARRDKLGALGPVETFARPDQAVEAGLALASRVPIRGVVAFSETMAFHAGLLANLLGLPANPPAALTAARRKDIQRARLAAAGMPTPGWRLIGGEQDLGACADLRFPVVLKPAVGVSSFCVARVTEPAGLAGAYADAGRRYQANPWSNGADRLFLVEEEIVGSRWHADARFGHQVSVESILHEGTVHHLGVTDKTPVVPPFREEGHLTPSALDPSDLTRVTTVAEQAIRALGLTTGAVHTELMLTADGPVVLEVNGRLAGCMYGLMQFSREYDIARAIAQVACGQAPDLPGAPLRFAAFVRPQPPTGRHRVAAVDQDALDEALKLADWGMLDKPVGSELDSDDGSISNLARYVTTAPDSAALFESIERVNKAIRGALTIEPIT